MLHFVAPDEFPTKGRFLERYANMQLNPFSGFVEAVSWKEGDRRKELDAIVEPHLLRRPIEAVHNVKEPIRELIEAELLPKQRKAYKSLAEKMVAEVEGGATWASHPLKRMTRLRQLAAAYGEVTHEIRDDKPYEGLRLTEPSSKLDSMESTLRDLGDHQAVLFTESRQLLLLAADRLGDKALLLMGGQTDNVRDHNIERFQAGDVQYLLKNRIGGVGISLDAADTFVWIQKPWDHETVNQDEKRIYKEGRASLIIELRSPDTVEEDIALSIAEQDADFETLYHDRQTILALLHG
jgi:SNF2 family DNA or RNA helicase